MRRLEYSHTFLPVLSGSTDPTCTYTVQSGIMLIIGRLCQVHIRLVLSAISGGSGSNVIRLPFTVAGVSDDRYIGACNWGGLTLPAGYTQVSAFVGGGTDYLRLSRSGSGVAHANVQISEIGATADIRVSILLPMR